MSKIYTEAYFKKQGGIGGKKRAANLTAERRREIAVKARAARTEKMRLLREQGKE